MALSAMATMISLQTPIKALKSDADRRLSSAKNLHGSLHKSVFPLAVKSFQQSTCSKSSSKLRMKIVGAKLENEKTEMEPAPEIGVAVFIIKDDKILLGRRGSLYIGSNTYGLPAGHLEFGESYEECTVREMKEEIGLDIKNIEYLTTNNLYYDATHLNIIYMRANLSDPNQTPQNVEPDKCDGWEWYDLNNLPEPMFGPLREMLKAGFNPFHNVKKPVICG